MRGEKGTRRDWKKMQGWEGLEGKKEGLEQMQGRRGEKGTRGDWNE